MVIVFLDSTALQMVGGIARAAALAFILTQATIGRRAAVNAAAE